jgi:hypothetical protein
VKSSTYDVQVSFEEDAIPVDVVDPYWTKVVLLAHFDGADNSTTITDTSPSNHSAITINGNTRIRTAASGVTPPLGQSMLYVDGTGDYITITDNKSDWAFGTGDFTIECWFLRKAYTDAAVIVGAWAGTAATSAWLISQGSAGGAANGIRFGMSNGSSFAFVESSNNLITTDTWAHIAVCRAGTTLKIFVNGIVVYSGTNSTNISPVTSLGIGGVTNGTYTSNCYIDDLRITKGVARYTSNFALPTTEYPDW